MSAMTNYLENKVLDHVLGTASYTMPTVYLALFTAVADGEAGTVTEVSGNGYARQLCVFDAAASGTAANAAQETFTASGGNWGTITHWGLYDAETNGNLLIYGALDASRTINDGDSLTFAAGAIDITAA
jgi:hypothetical protein